MDRKTLIVGAVIAGVLAVAVPIAASLHLATRQAQAQEYTRLQGVADEVLRRSMETRRQIDAMVAELRAVSDAPCSEAAIDRMREIDIASIYLQAVGHVEGTRLLCSSLGRHGEGYELGAPRSGPEGNRAWIGTRLPFVPKDPVNVYEVNGFAAIVHPALAMDVRGVGAEVALATVLLEPRLLVRASGPVRPEWIARADQDARYSDGDHFIVTRKAHDGRSAVLAASPVDSVRQHVRDLALWLVPTGILGGGLLALVVFLAARQLLSLPAAIRTALRRQELYMLYQPVIDLDSGRCVGAEALVRWRRGRDIVSPDVFIPAAEQSGLITQITRRVTELVARDTSELLARHPGVHIAINLSSDDLESGDTAGLIEELLDRARAEPRNFVVEATERGFLDAHLARTEVHKLRTRGVRVAIDDFGTGYSSLSYLASFELDFLKIDKSFVDTLGTEAATSQVALHIIEMAKSLKLAIIAEGIETQAQADILRARGVQFAQGWLYGRPQPVAELLARLDAQAKGG